MRRAPSTFVALMIVLLPAVARPQENPPTDVPETPGATEMPTSNDDSNADYIERMRREHADDEPSPTGASQTAPRQPVESGPATYGQLGGEDLVGYLARPAGAEGTLPGVVVIHEWWGLNDNIRAMADRLAGEGYVALAVDLYGGEAAADPDAARAMMQAAMENEPAIEDNLRQAVATLREATGGGRLGVIGWCFGGGWSLRTALLEPDAISATVVYYGHLIAEPKALEPLQSPLLGIFGAEDQGITVESVRAFEAALQSLSKPAEIHVYEGAGHAFANPSGHNYRAEAAEDAWNRTLAFFDEHLKSE